MRYTIYKICCKDYNVTDCYVGSTKHLSNRIQTHKAHCNNFESRDHHLKIYKFIRDNGRWYNWHFVPLQIVDCETKQDAYKAEQYWIQNLNANLNCYKPPTGLESKEYDKQYYLSLIHI